jgi:hypothetical protein
VTNREKLEQIIERCYRDAEQLSARHPEEAKVAETNGDCLLLVLATRPEEEFERYVVAFGKAGLLPS